MPWPAFLAPLVVALSFLAAWSLAPRAFLLDGGELVVDRPLFPVRVPLASVRGVSLVSRAQAGALVKVAGAGGVFGHYGRYWSRGLGAFRLYATRRDPLVVVDTDAGRFVLTPATPERFVEALGRRAPGAARNPAGTGPTGSPGTPWKPLLAVAFGVPLLIGVILGVAWGRAPCAVTLEADAIRIDRRWGGPERLPLAHIRGVEPLTPEQARGWWRVDGVGGLGGTSYGRFRSDRLGPFTLHAWRRGPYVLLETAGGKVVLTPDDPDAFVTGLRARLGR
jgi:hypothetical protein